jgi:undecaprenyl phosphate-alpha-L-ara4FN deformylase
MEIALKIDVDTHDGLRVGVPRLAQLLVAERLRASFYISMGPDNSGRALIRVFRNRGFLRKMWRTRAPAMYGWRTIVSGTLLPARPIALAFPEMVRQLARSGFEVGVHGYDHVRWQDNIDRLGESGLRQELLDGCEAFRAIMGQPPQAFAAPGWRTNEAALRLLDELRLSYHSDTRGRGPYRVALGDTILTTPEIPTTLPTLDEVMGRAGLRSPAAVTRFYFDRLAPEGLNVHTIHAETEGMGQLESFTHLVRELKASGANFVRLDEIAQRLVAAELPVCAVVRREIPGRAGWIAAQNEPLDSSA